MKFALVIFMSTLAATSSQKPVCLITAPNVIHVDTDETVTVQVHGATKPVSITLFFKKQVTNWGESDLLSNKETVVLDENNDYQAIAKLKVPLSIYKNVKSLPHVQLVAESNDVFEKKRVMENIILSSRKGYIFIQTNKPIYNPGENANFRVFTLDQYLLPRDETINLKILNSKGLIVYNNMLKSKQIHQQRIAIPDVEPAGHWKIIAWFKDLPMSNTTGEFEVKEYSLPSFEVKIEAPRPYYLLKETSFEFSVSARYTYGKGLNGIAYVRFALMDEHGNKMHLPGLEIQTPINDGSTKISLLTEDLQRIANNRTTENIEGHVLYIAVTVLETASGELEEAESSSVKIVSMPYDIDLSKTKQYFTPEGKLFILATTVHPDGTPVPHPQMKATVEVSKGTGESFHLKATGNEDGEVMFSLKVPKQAEALSIKVFAMGETEDTVLGHTHMNAAAVASPSKSYLSIDLPHVTLKENQEMTVIFKDVTPPDLTRPTHIYYLILSKGKVVQAKRVRRSDQTTVTLPFSNELTPSFRIVAYYYIQHGGQWTIVTDSVWVDAQDVCKGQIQITPFKPNYKPAEQVNVEVRMSQGDRVTLAAVDTAVYILNKQNKLTPQKMFDYMNSYDLACSMGGGKDHLSVLHDAGLAYISSIQNLESKRRLDFSCSGGKTRQKRALNYASQFSAIVNKYRTLEERKCCTDGVKVSPLKLSCIQRLTKTVHQLNVCQDIFYKCCKAATDLREKIRKSKKRYSLARTNEEEEEDLIDETNVQLRSFFPQTWMWVEVHQDVSGLFKHTDAVPDSITTWEVQAIGISATKGFCVAKPQPLRVFQDFFVSLKLPYSVKRNEQLEVKAVVYNYRAESLKVTVQMVSVEGLCSAGDERNKQVVTVPGNSATPVYFVVVPLTIGNIPIQVIAFASENLVDKIKKDLKVVGEGELVSVQYEHNLDAKATVSMEIETPAPLKSIPGEEWDTHISIKGGVMGESVENCLNLEGLNKLITLPTGCAEQTMVKMSPAIHAIQYLDATNQWINLRAERRDEALEMIQSGYNRILRYKKDDGSYGAFEKTPSSVWLTAFVAKELIRCRGLIPVEDSYILQSISYLVSKQLENGAFNDPHPVYDRNMQGGVGGVEGDVSLTSFVLVTLHHSLHFQSTEQSTLTITAVDKAKRFLAQKLDSLQRPFAVGIAAYALTLVGPGSDVASRAQSKLRQLAKCDEGKDTCHWKASEDLRLTGETKASGVPQASAISVETTAYALLQTLLGQDQRYAIQIAKWLMEQRQYGGGFRSTQDTVVALEALSKYSMQSNDVQELDMMVELCLPSEKKKLFLSRRNALTATAFQVQTGNKLKVNIAGTGNATLTVVQTYRTMKKAESHCHYYHLNVSVEGEVKYKQHSDYGEGLYDYYNYEEGDDGTAQKDEPWSQIEWFDLRSRRKRHAPEMEEKERTLMYTVCAGTKAGNATGMAIVDISLLSGLEVNLQDLEDCHLGLGGALQYSRGTEKYIDHYDAEPNKVYLYFNKLTESPDCVMFRAKQITPIGLVQPASAVVYDYYNPDRRCSIFYSAPKQSTLISKLCKEDVCACAEGHCPKIKVTFSKNMEKNTRSDYACFSPIVDYVFLVKVIQTREDGVFNYYTVFITKVLQSGKDGVLSGDMREMVHRKSCNEFEMKTKSEYLLMGKDASIAETTDSNEKNQYILTRDVWVEEIPEERKCKATKNRRACQLLHDFLQQYELEQCRH